MDIKKEGDPALKFTGEHKGMKVNFKCHNCRCDVDYCEDEIIEVVEVPMHGPNLHISKVRCPNCNQVLTAVYKKFSDAVYYI